MICRRIGFHQSSTTATDQESCTRGTKSGRGNPIMTSPESQKLHSTAADRIRYLRQDHIFIVDLSGKIDSNQAAEISGALRDFVKSHEIRGKAIKFLIDFRKVKWDSEETHMKVRQITAKYLHDILHGHKYFLAILNEHVVGESLRNECFFTQEQNALHWLRSM